MKFTPEMIDKFSKCSTPEELMALAEENGMKLSLEEAKEALEMLVRVLTSEETEQVTGGVTGCVCNDWGRT